MDKDIKESLWVMFGVVVVWLIASTVCSLLGLFNQPNRPPIFFGLFLVGPILGFLVVYTFSNRMQAALFALPLWAITATHSLRLVGIAFVMAGWRHELAPAFGWLAGGGDILSAVLSIPLSLAMFQKRYSSGLRARFIVWNIFGMIGLVLSITLGLLYSPSALGILSNPLSNTRALSFLPDSLIPTFYVPILILLHLLALRRSDEIYEPSPRPAP